VTRREAEYLRAVDSGLKAPAVQYYLTYDFLSTGRFEKAADAARQLTATSPANLHYHMMYVDALMALERWDDALRENQRMVFVDPDNPFVVNERMILMMKSGEPERGEEYAEQFINRMRRDNGVPFANTWARFFKAQREYVRGDADAFAAELLRAPPLDGWENEALFCQGKLAEVADNIAEAPERSLDDHLLLVLLAMGKGDESFARDHLNAAIDLLRKDSPSDHDLIAAWLESETAPSADDVCLTPMPLRTKIAVLTILGLKHLAIREPCFNLAKRLDFDPQFPHLLIKGARESAK
jgi:tetratricopeptide (TPR) repeat protein